MKEAPDSILADDVGAVSLTTLEIAPVLTETQRYAKLTARERDVLRLVGQGYTAPEIGERLLISPKTVDTYKQRIQEKMGFTHRSHYVSFALRHGLLVADDAAP
jgi:DNA-binding CsgD family transcriptional regulator